MIPKLRIASRENLISVTPLGVSGGHKREKRGEIDCFSDASRRRMLKVARAVTGQVTVMITLTYADIPTDGKKCKKQLNKFLYELHDRGHEYFWFMEFQGRGSVHFHIYTSKYIDKDDAKQIWNDIVYKKSWNYERVKHRHRGCFVEAIRKPHALAFYAGKYAAKRDQKIAPSFYKGLGRFWGRSRGLKGTETCLEIEPSDTILFNIKCRKIKEDAVFAKKGMEKYGTFITWDEASINKIKSIFDEVPHISYDRIV